jgi:hypothetical protein
MNEIVDRYINGEKTEVLAKELGMCTSNLLEIFRGCLGKEWKRTFFSPRRNKKVPVPIPIPALIDDEGKIKAVLAQIESNKTWTHGSYKEDYIFSSMIFCNDCGHTLTGKTKKGIHYYYHYSKYKNNCSFKRNISEKHIETAVFSRLFHMYQDDEKLEEAVRREYPDQEKQKRLMATNASDSKEILKINRSIKNIVGAVGEGNIKPEQAKLKLDELEERKALFQNKINKRKPLLEVLPPTKKQINRNTQLLRRMVRECYSSPSRLSEMSFKDKRRLMELAFGSKDFKKNKLGVRIEQGSTEKAFKFTIRGQFSNHPDYREQISGELPESLAGIQEALRIDPYYEADYNPFDEVEIKKAQFKKKNRQKAHSRRGKVKSVCQHIVLPPSTVKQLPVTKSDQSEA